MTDLKSWWAIFPQGTKEGDEESRFFCSLSRHPEFEWRSVDKISEEARLPKTRVEEIIAKYAVLGMILQNPKKPDQWGYWERVGAKKQERSLLEEEHTFRLKKSKP